MTYDVTELDELVLAYVTTIHKAQGSEYPIVVMPFTMSHYVMLQRNLLYTGVTRAKKVLVLIGEKKAISYAVRNETTTSRNTKLAERLQDTATAPIVSRQILQTVGMKQSATTQQPVQIQSAERNKVTYFPVQDAEPLMVAEPPMEWIERQMKESSNAADRDH